MVSSKCLVLQHFHLTGWDIVICITLIYMYIISIFLAIHSMLFIEHIQLLDRRQSPMNYSAPSSVPDRQDTLISNALTYIINACFFLIRLIHQYNYLPSITLITNEKQ
jgi:hypothetical protein